MPVFTINDLATRAASQADMHDQFIKPAEWLAWYNQERRALQLFMVRHGAAMQNLNVQSVTGPDVVSLSNEYIALVGVWETRGGRFRQLRITDFPSNFYQTTGGPQTGPADFVTVEDINNTGSSSTNLRFYPRDTSGTYLIVTALAPPVASTMFDQTSLQMGIEERIVLGMARRALIKEESDTREVEKLMREQDQIIEEFVSARAMAQTMKVRNVDAVERNYGWRGELLYPEANRWVWL